MSLRPQTQRTNEFNVCFCFHTYFEIIAHCALGGKGHRRPCNWKSHNGTIIECAGKNVSTILNIRGNRKKKQNKNICSLCAKRHFEQRLHSDYMCDHCVNQELDNGWSIILIMSSCESDTLCQWFQRSDFQPRNGVPENRSENQIMAELWTPVPEKKVVVVKNEI